MAYWERRGKEKNKRRGKKIIGRPRGRGGGGEGDEEVTDEEDKKVLLFVNNRRPWTK